MTASRIGRILLGAFLILGSLACVPVWLFAAAWVGATADIRIWAVFCGLLAPLVLVFVVGAGLLWRFPSGRGWLAWGVVVILPLGLLLFVFQDNHGAARVNPAVSRAYEELREETFFSVYTVCEYVTGTTGSESWVCEVEPYGRDLDTCHVVVRRISLWRVAVRIASCSVDQDTDRAGHVNAQVERAYERSRHAVVLRTTCLDTAGSIDVAETWICRVLWAPRLEGGRHSGLDVHRDTCTVKLRGLDDRRESARIENCGGASPS
jgi:hypothetical protein